MADSTPAKKATPAAAKQEPNATTPGASSPDTTIKTDTNPNVTTGDNIVEGGTLSDNISNLPADRPGFHCGYCGAPVGPEGQHYDAVTGDVTTVEHAGTLVVADNWPENQDAQDASKREAVQAQRDEAEEASSK